MVRAIYVAHALVQWLRTNNDAEDENAKYNNKVTSQSMNNDVTATSERSRRDSDSDSELAVKQQHDDDNDYDVEIEDDGDDDGDDFISAKHNKKEGKHKNQYE